MTPEERVREVLGAVVERSGGAPYGWEARIAGYLGLLEARNRVVNLISRKTAPEVLERQVLPSLAALDVVPPNTPLRVLDVGTGGGLPGIPLRIIRPAIRLDLADATRKKCDFLRDCIQELGLEGVAVHWCRIELPPAELVQRAPFDRMLARAMGGEALLAASAETLLAPDGEIWVFTAPGPGARPWLDAAGRTLTALRRLR